MALSSTLFSLLLSFSLVFANLLHDDQTTKMPKKGEPGEGRKGRFQDRQRRSVSIQAVNMSARQLSGGRDGALSVVLSSPLSQPCIRFWRNRRVTRSRTQNISAPKKAEKGKGRNPKQGLKADYIALHLLRFSGRTNVTAIIIIIFLFLQQFAHSFQAVVRWRQRWCCPQPCSLFFSCSTLYLAISSLMTRQPEGQGKGILRRGGN